MLEIIKYTAGFVANPIEAFKTLWEELDWERRGSTPRREYYCNEVPMPYTYGSGAGIREYLPKAWHPTILSIKEAAEIQQLPRYLRCLRERYPTVSPRTYVSNWRWLKRRQVLDIYLQK